MTTEPVTARGTGGFRSRIPLGEHAPSPPHGRGKEEPEESPPAVYALATVTSTGVGLANRSSTGQFTSTASRSCS